MSIAQKIKQQLKSKTVRKDLALLASAGVAYLAANPAVVAAYGPGAVAAFAILGIYLRNKTDRAIKDIE